MKELGINAYQKEELQPFQQQDAIYLCALDFSRIAHHTNLDL
jgi:hypothetical protein